ncbi:MAG: hypothetical protein J0653_00165, partial [Deltaproteobacteria bacterium]|nr:hypothetical protein [Deltaproteobacteria bacterium]
HKLAALYQIFSDIKPVLSLALGYAFAWNSRVEKALWFLVRWFWLPCILMVAFEWLLPNIYYKLFAAGTVAGISEDPVGLLPSRAVGVFEHSSFLAAVTKELPSCWFAVIMNFSLIICAVQRQEMVAFVIAGAMIFALANPHKMFSRLSIGVVVTVLAIVAFVTVFQRNLEKEAAQWGYGTVGALQQPRAQIFAGAILTAKTYYPLGAGLGTYGGAGAEKFDTSLYDRLGFS